MAITKAWPPHNCFFLGANAPLEPPHRYLAQFSPHPSKNGTTKTPPKHRGLGLGTGTPPACHHVANGPSTATTKQPHVPRLPNVGCFLPPQMPIWAQNRFLAPKMVQCGWARQNQANVPVQLPPMAPPWHTTRPKGGPSGHRGRRKLVAQVKFD